MAHMKFVEAGSEGKKFEMRKPLGEHEPALRGVDMKSTKGGAVGDGISFDVSSTADKVVVDALLTHMEKTYFQKDGDQYIFTGASRDGSGPNMTNAVDAISAIMDNPDMQKVVAERRPAMEAADQARNEAREAENAIKQEEAKKFWEAEAQRKNEDQAGADALKAEIKGE